MRTILIAAAIFAAATTTAAHAQRAADPLDARIETAHVDAFFRIYDVASGRPDAAALQPYIDNGSAGVRGFIPNRIVSAENLAARVAQRPQIYSDARTCAQNLGDVRARVRAAFLALEALYPEATYPQTYILIGANNSGGTANSEALMIGLEVMCRSGSPDTSALDIRLTHIIAHEMVHSLQSSFAGETVLSQSLNEGAAEFIAELMTGRISNNHLIEWTAGREAEIEQRFAADMDNRDLSTWLYNGVGTPEAPGDLGYWVGYRIVRDYYERAPDKRQAIGDILRGTDARAFLAASGWRPGVQ
ncbi:MAG: lytic murein transglycosylase [Alphaproteobacteria bacterium]|nr:MAG: lytic murein transglycosylase [Alphaproteobacteria bacterium]